MNYKNKIISVIGLGYIGLPTAAILASKDYDVYGIDINSQIVDNIRNKKVHILEDGLEEVLNLVISSKKLKVFDYFKPSDIYIICVPTPFYEDTYPPKPNIDFIKNVIMSVKNFLKKEDIIIIESTSPIGTLNIIQELLKSEDIDTDDLYLAYCPERVIPGNTMNELIKNDRVIGGINQISTEIIANFYKSFVSGKVLKTDSKTAELCKLAENSFRDVNIAFANELSFICSDHNINVWDLIKLTNHHPRVNILQPGPGVGGHCIAVDPWFLVYDNSNAKLIEQARIVNNSKPDWVVNKILHEVKAQKINKSDVTVACLGLTFKPDIDDIRESPSIEIVNKLKKNKINLLLVDPNIKQNNIYPIVDVNLALNKANIIVILVKHSNFRNIIPLLNNKNKIILDFCGMLE